jgi:SAM-dependent methyltransferase
MRDELIAAALKHLPPSSAHLRLLAVEGAAVQRGDLDVTVITGAAAEWQLAPDSFDAVTACDAELSADFLAACLNALRPGGRLIVVQSEGEPNDTWLKQLEGAGYTRILIEAALDQGGLLLRGEKPHTEARTVDRIRQVADLDQYAGRYLHLLIRQTPNKPVWALRPDDVITWHAAAVQGSDGAALLAFSSLPKAVAFMQPAVMQGLIRDINKVGKFSREIARAWDMPLLLNPDIEALSGCEIVFSPVDAQTAEAPDE